MKKKLIYTGIAFVCLALIAGMYFFVANRQAKSGTIIVASSTLPTISLALLALHDGTDPNLPIYIGLDGYVYDVTPGKSFYIVGGSYHNLAGKDSSQALQFFGADIIKEKYHIIGVLRQ